MRINVRLLSSLRQYFPYDGSNFQIELEAGATVNQIQSKLQIPPSVTQVILVNGYHGNGDTVLVDDDTVTLFPPMGGG
jgi:molybdopterin synthase sulfur carrier subunit